MNEAWSAVVAALGASILTILGTYGLERFREGRTDKVARTDRHTALYLELLVATGAIMVNYATLRAIANSTGRWFHPLKQLLKADPAQPSTMEVLRLFHEPFERLMKAWADAYLVFDQEEIVAVNRLVNRIQALDLKVEQGNEKSAEHEIGAARREFAQFARTRIGAEAVDLALGASDFGKPDLP